MTRFTTKLARLEARRVQAEYFGPELKERTMVETMEITVTVLTPDAYHADFSRDSNSSLSLFKSSIEAYAAIRVHRTMEPKPPTDAMIFGQAFDTYLLEPEHFDARFVQAPKCDRRTNVGKASWAVFIEQSEGKTPLDADAMALLESMAAAVRRNAWAAMAMEAPGECQKVLTWDDPSTGLPLKMRCDKLIETASGRILLDVKTAADVSPAGLARSVANFGYHRQAALYLSGLWHAAQLDSVPFIFLAVGKEPPHEVVTFSIDDAAIARGHEENDALLAELAERKASGNWVGRWSDEIQTVSLPRWATY